MYVGVDNDDDNGGVDNDDMIMVVLMKIKRRFFTHSLFCPRGPGGPPEAVRTTGVINKNLHECA